MKKPCLRNARPKRCRQRPVGIEPLEPRALLDATGLLWGIDGRLSVSFAPDGTPVAQHQSDLFAQFESLGTTQQWQNAILRGLQTWAQHTNIDIGQMIDDGSPFGQDGATTGDERFGDIRVAAIPMGADIFATSVPTDQFADGTWVGDILFNSNAEIQSLDELFAIAVHEAGHVFGIDHSADNNSPMFGHAIPSTTVPTSHDLDLLAKNFGRREQDLLEQAEQQGVANIISLHPDTSLLPSLLFAQLDQPEDTDRFTVEQTESLSEPLAVRLITDEISQLHATLRVRNDIGELLGEATYQDQGEFGQLIVLDSSHVQEGDLTIEVLSEALSPHNIGAYTLIVSQGRPKPIPPHANGQDNGVGNFRRTVENVARSRFRELTPQEISMYLNDQLNGRLAADDEILIDDECDAGNPVEFTSISTSRLVATSSLAGSADSDLHHLVVPDDVAPGTAMFVSLVSMSRTSRFQAMASVFDSAGQPVATVDVLRNQYASIVQVREIEPGEDFGIQVQLHPDSQVPRGNYELAVRFGAPGFPPELTYTGSVSSSASQEYTMGVHRTQLFRFGLRGEPTDTASQLTATIQDAQQQVVLSLDVPHEEFRTATVLLPPDEYVIRLETSGASDDQQAFTLTADVIDVPLGVEPVDPTESQFCGFDWLNEWISCLRVLGDTNGDGKVNFDDFLILSANFGTTDAVREEGDLNGDTVVDFDDFLILSGRFGLEPEYEDG